MINSSRDMIPDEILLPKHPFVDDVTEVEDAIERQREAEDAELEKQMKLYGNQGFGGKTPVGTSTLPKVTSNKDDSKSQKAKSNTNS